MSMTTTMYKNQQFFTLHDVTQRLQLDHQVVEAILTTLVQKGYLVEIGQWPQPNSSTVCGTCPHHPSRSTFSTTFAWTQSYGEGETKPMIHLIMAEIKRSQRALSLPELSQQLQVDRAVLDGMVTMLVKRGYLVEVPYRDVEEPCACGCATCPRRQPAIFSPVYQLAETSKANPDRLDHAATHRDPLHQVSVVME